VVANFTEQSGFLYSVWGFRFSRFRRLWVRVKWDLSFSRCWYVGLGGYLYVFRGGFTLLGKLLVSGASDRNCRSFGFGFRKGTGE